MTSAIPPGGLPVGGPSGVESFAPEAARRASSDTFQEWLVQGLEDLHQMQQDAEQAVQRVMIGEASGTAEVLTAVKKAELAFQLMMQVRNKLVEAFREIENLRI